MFTITLSTEQGETITADNTADLIEFARRNARGRTPFIENHFIENLEDALRTGRLTDAGVSATRLGLNFAFAVPLDDRHERYYVPVDPADATICESCE